MATGGASPASHQAPKILLAKPGLITSGKFNRGGADDDSTALRPRIPPIGSLNLLSDSWEFLTDRFLPFLTDNTDFTVVGVIGPPGVGKSTIMNEIYGTDSTSPGMLPAFSIQSEEIRAMSKHCTVGIETRVSTERIILLDTQPVFSPSLLAEMIRPDGSSTVSVIAGESLSAELAHELMSIQLGVFLVSICHIIIVVSEGVHDLSMWQLMSTVDLLKHGIPDPSSLSLSHPQSSTFLSEKEGKDKTGELAEEYMATPVFVHTKLRNEDLSPHTFTHLSKALANFFGDSSFMRSKDTSISMLKLFLLPSNHKDNSSRALHESSLSALWKLRDQVLSMSGSSFSRTVSERDWLKNSAKIWDLVKGCSTISDYCKTLQTSGMFRR